MPLPTRDPYLRTWKITIVIVDEKSKKARFNHWIRQPVYINVFEGNTENFVQDMWDDPVQYAYDLAAYLENMIKGVIDSVTVSHEVTKESAREQNTGQPHNWRLIPVEGSDVEEKAQLKFIDQSSGAASYGYIPTFDHDLLPYDGSPVEWFNHFTGLDHVFFGMLTDPVNTSWLSGSSHLTSGRALTNAHVVYVSKVFRKK